MITCGLDDPGPALTPAEAAAFHDQPEGMAVAWFAVPAPVGREVGLSKNTVADIIKRNHAQAPMERKTCPGIRSIGDWGESARKLVFPSMGAEAWTSGRQGRQGW